MSEGTQPVQSAGTRRPHGRRAIAGVVVLAAAGGFVGWASARPTYRSVGLISIAPKLPKIVYATDESGLLPLFDQYVDSQAQLLSSRRVVDMAMQSPEWRKLARAASNNEVASFVEGLSITCRKNGQVLEVAFVDADPSAAKTAVDQVIRAYMRMVDERDSMSGSQTLSALQTRRGIVSNKLSELRAREISVTDGLGDKAVEARYDACVAELIKLESALRDLDMDVATSGSGDDGPTEQELALKDRTLELLLESRTQARERAASLPSRGVGTMHPEVVAAQQEIDALNRRIADRAAGLRASAAAAHQERLRQRALLVANRERVEEQTKSLVKQQFELANLSAERRTIEEQLDATKRRLDEINVESGVHGRTTVVSMGERPVTTYSDPRVTLALLGAVGGLSLGSGIVFVSRRRNAAPPA